MEYGQLGGLGAFVRMIVELDIKRGRGHVPIPNL